MNKTGYQELRSYNRFLFFICFGLVIFFQSYASALPQDDNFSVNSEIFRKTKTLCGKANSPEGNFESQVGGFSRFLLEGAKNGFLFWEPNSLKLTPETKFLVESPGYEAALYACFGDDHLKRKIFTAVIISEDIAGHLLGLSAWIFPVSRITRAFQRTNWVLTHPELFGGIKKTLSLVNKIGLVGIIGYMGFEQYKSNKSRDSAGENLAAFNDAMVDSTELEADDSFSILSAMLADTNRQLAQPLEPGKRKALERKKVILEDRLNERGRPPAG